MTICRTISALLRLRSFWSMSWVSFRYRDVLVSASAKLAAAASGGADGRVAAGVEASPTGSSSDAGSSQDAVKRSERRSASLSLKGAVEANEDALVPLGKARLAREGEHLTIIAYAAMVHEALSAAETLASEGASVEVLDLRSLKPLDSEAIMQSVAKTGKVLIVHEANLTCGVGSEVAALIAQHAFQHLDGPIMRLAAPDTPVPYSPPLEDAYRPNAAKILASARELLAF